MELPDSGILDDDDTGIGAVAVAVVVAVADRKENIGMIVQGSKAIQGQASVTLHNCGCWNEQAPEGTPRSFGRSGPRSTETGRMGRVEEICVGVRGRQRRLSKVPGVLMVNFQIH